MHQDEWEKHKHLVSIVKQMNQQMIVRRELNE